MLALALVAAILPQATTCASEGKALTLSNGNTAPMKCSWTAKGEIAVAVPLAVVGATVVVSRRKETRRNLAIVGIVLGAFVILLPTSLIGVCTSHTAICNTLMKPALVGIGSLAIAASVFGLILSARGSDKQP